MIRPELYVEGKDDFHAITHVLIRHGIDYDEKPRSRAYPEIHAQEGYTEVLNAIEVRIPRTHGVPIGFVIDGDLEPLWPPVTLSVGAERVWSGWKSSPP
jgi:hypothetical protein